MDIKLNLRRQVDSTSTDVSNLSRVVLQEDPLHGKGVGFSVRDYLVGNEGRRGCPLVCEVVEGENSTLSGQKATFSKEVGRARRRLIGISEFKYWTIAYTLSGFFAALTGSLLLGWSGGGFIGVGDPYLFTTLAAVVIGGTSLLGGKFSLAGTVLGALIIQTLTYTTYSIGVPPEATLVVKAAVVLVVSVIQSATARTVIMRQLKRALPYALKKPLSEAAK